jgi:hypothetical protein
VYTADPYDLIKTNQTLSLGMRLIKVKRIVGVMFGIRSESTDEISCSSNALVCADIMIGIGGGRAIACFVTAFHSVVVVFGCWLLWWHFVVRRDPVVTM